MQRVSRLSGWLGSAAASVGLGAPAGSRDWALWRAARAGDATAATRLVRALTPQAWGLAVQLVGKPEDAQDAVQDAFLRLWRSEPSDTRGATLATYFNTIVINCCRSFLGQRRELATEQEALTDLHDAHQQRDASPDDASAAAHGLHGFGARSAQARLQQALDTLPPRQRVAIAMWTYADASAADIARTLDIDANAAHQLLHRAKLGLRAQLEGASR